MQPYSHLSQMPIALAESACKESVDNLNQLLADTMTRCATCTRNIIGRCLGPTFYQLHLLFDKHADEQNKLVDAVAERNPAAGWGQRRHVPDVAETTFIPRPPKGREEVPCECRGYFTLTKSKEVGDGPPGAEEGDDGTNDLLVSDVIRTNELQVWFVAEHVVDRLWSEPSDDGRTRKDGKLLVGRRHSARTTAVMDDSRDELHLQLVGPITSLTSKSLVRHHHVYNSNTPWPTPLFKHTPFRGCEATCHGHFFQSFLGACNEDMSNTNPTSSWIAGQQHGQACSIAHQHIHRWLGKHEPQTPANDVSLVHA